MHRREGLNWPLLLVFYALSVAFLAVRRWNQLDTSPLFIDTDDAMRMVVVRDFLLGQNWFDHIVHRANTPFGAPLHWSRLIDAPIALLVLLARPFSLHQAEAFAGFVWPLLLLFPYMVLTSRLTLRLVGREGLLPAAILPVFALPVLSEFSPGRVDHHSVQIILSVAMVYCTIRALDTWRHGAWAGLAAATAIAIGIESLPMVGAALAVFGLLFVFRPQAHKSVIWFGLAFAGGTALHLALFLPPSQWLVPACDAISIVYLVAACGCGLGLAALASVSIASWRLRLVAGAILAVAVVAAILIIFPECRRGPYGMVDPWLAQNWLANILEARPLWLQLTADPNFVLPVTISMVLGLAVNLHAIARTDGEDRAGWLVLFGFFVLSSLVALLQVRGLRLAGSLMIPMAAYAIVHARHAYLRRMSLGSIAGLIGAWLGFCGLALALLTHLVWGALETSRADTLLAEQDRRNQCIMPQNFADLAALPAERIMALTDLGSHLLLYTDHAIVGSPYHRDQAGLLDTFRFFNQPLDQARQILDNRRINLVVVCEAMPESNGLEDKAPDSFLALMDKNALPAWLKDVTPPGAVLRTYAVLPPTSPPAPAPGASGAAAGAPQADGPA